VIEENAEGISESLKYIKMRLHSIITENAEGMK
jgi:hypothetical protein